MFESAYQDFGELANDKYGSKILIQCLETSAKESISHYQMFVELILDEVSNIRFLLNQYCNSIIQKAVQIFKDEHLEPLLIGINSFLFIEEQKIRGICYNNTDLCYDQFGCLIV